MGIKSSCNRQTACVTFGVTRKDGSELRYVKRMVVTVPNNRLRRDIEDDAARKKRFGKEMAQKIGLRMAALVAAESLADFWPPHSGPERVHELKKGDLLGMFSIDLKHPFRLLFSAVDAERKKSGDDERKRWESIKSVEIIGVEDTHG